MLFGLLTGCVPSCNWVELHLDGHPLSIDLRMLSEKHGVYLAWEGMSSCSRDLGTTGLRESNSFHCQD